MFGNDAGYCRRAVTWFLLLGGLFLFAGPGRLRAGVEGTPHDMTIALGDPFSGPCVFCHLPHKAKGERLWSTVTGGPETGWGSRPIAQLCYTCHQAGGGGFSANDVTMNAFSPLAHGYTVAEAPQEPDGTDPELLPLPYVAAGLMDCTTCHDPHSNTPPFLQEEGIDSLCKGCHRGRENPDQVGEGNSFFLGEVLYSLHPTDMEYADLGANGPTGLEPYPDLLQQPTVSGEWRLGAHRVGWQAGSGSVSCQTCHPVHGGHRSAEDVAPESPVGGLTPIADSSFSALCQACHQGGEEGETVGVLSDHPINTNDGLPETTFPEGWPAGAQGEVTCSSCHRIHGGIEKTSLLRKGGNETDGWCYSCHDLLSLTPPYHHSSREIDDPAIFESVLTCGSCHGGGEGWTAHNGFEGFKAEVTVNDSDFCEICHQAEDPTSLDAQSYTDFTGFFLDFSAARYPAGHGRVSGKDSHLVNDIDDDSVKNCYPKTTVWETSGGLSEYGLEGEILCESCHAILLNAGIAVGVDEESRLTGGWKSNLLLEPYEDNDPGIGYEAPNYVPGPTMSALCRGCHYSQSEGVEPSFVHNPEAHTVVDYVYPEDLTPYGRETDSILTVPIDSVNGPCPEVSSADQMVPLSGLGVPFAPGLFSYPAEHLLDCDSCHRPHGADSSSADDGIHRILEYTAPGQHGTVPCFECHDVNTQCGYEHEAGP